MSDTVKAVAYANIALTKYWGKRPGAINAPATPSVSLALNTLKTETTISVSESGYDQFFLDGKKAEGKTKQRFSDYLSIWRDRGLLNSFFRVDSANNFPTASGLASSASGFAALAKGLSCFASKKISTRELSRLARIGSGSAARSVTGALSAMPLSDNPFSYRLLQTENIDWGMVITVLDNEQKAISSRDGMRLSLETSRYYKSWVSSAKNDYSDIIKAVKNSDLTKTGEIAEKNALAMHCCMMTSIPSLMYWNGTTIDVIKSVGVWRKDGIESYITIDAGPNVAILCNKDDLDKIAELAGNIKGVKDTIVCQPAGGAEIKL